MDHVFRWRIQEAEVRRQKDQFVPPHLTSPPRGEVNIPEDDGAAVNKFHSVF